MKYNYLINSSANKRHIFKSITWRVVASIDTFIIANFITGHSLDALKISLFEVLTKLFLYYLHEKIWFNSPIRNTKIRHLIKPFSWRLIGTLDTFLISYLITGSFINGIQISLIESLTKILLFYLHDKIWYKSKYGLN